MRCLTGWRGLVCWADDLLHALGVTLRPLCDWHDRLIWREFEDAA